MEKASTRIKFYHNENGPTISVVSKPVIFQDGLYFKDLTGDGVLTDYKDWRNSPLKRAKALAKELSVDEKIGLLFVNSWKMGIYQKDKNKLDETGLLVEETIEKDESIFNVEKTYGTHYTLEKMGIRHLILRENPTADELADWINELNLVCEETSHAIPALVVSNSRNEYGETVFGMNDASGVFASWPGTLGIASAVRGTDLNLINDFSKAIKEMWDAVGLKKGYMYMADVASDPRWQRTYGTFGEDPQLISDIFSILVPVIQGSDQGVTRDGVALTVKHFPGGGARENGFDPHYKQGQWNVYATPDSLKKYHLPAFKAAIEKNVSSIMPYYAKPSLEKSTIQHDLSGNKLELVPRGFAFNEAFIQKLLREQLEFKGYVNSDSGITNKMAWGVEELDIPSRIALAINSGVDIISGSLDVFNARIAYERGKNDYYETHPVPNSYTKEQLVLSDDALTKAVERTLKELFELGLFDNPYRDPNTAKSIISNPKYWQQAYDVHLKSVVLLKNKNQVLPLTANKLQNKKVYVEYFSKKEEMATQKTETIRKLVREKFHVDLTDDYRQADYAILLVNPKSGEYFNSTPGFLELDICENKMVCDVDELGRPSQSVHLETTLYNTSKIRTIYNAVKSNQGMVISNINFTLPWIVKNVEQSCDALLAGFDTFEEATLDVIFGQYHPTGKMPITLPRNDLVIGVNANGECTSPNDVPGYDKDQYILDDFKDENGKSYAYRDECDHYYELDFGLSYE